MTNSAFASGCARRAWDAWATLDVERDAPGRVDLGLDVDGRRPGVDERREQALVGVARDDDGVARAGDREDQGVDPARRSVDEEVTAVGAPRLGRILLGEMDEAGRLARVLHGAGHGEVDLQAGVAEQLAQLRRRSLAELVPGGVEGRVAAPPVGEDGVQVRCVLLIVPHGSSSRRAAGPAGPARSAHSARSRRPRPSLSAGCSALSSSRSSPGVSARRGWVIHWSAVCRRKRRGGGEPSTLTRQ